MSAPVGKSAENTALTLKSFAVCGIEGTVELPDGWSFERIPADTDISNQFGSCSLSVNLTDGNLLVLNIDRTCHEGIYPVEAFDDINTVCGFFKNLSRIKLPLAKDQEGSRL